jgi:hypothetical protein
MINCNKKKVNDDNKKEMKKVLDTNFPTACPIYVTKLSSLYDMSYISSCDAGAELQGMPGMHWHTL